MITGCVRASAVGEMLGCAASTPVRLGERADLVDCTTLLVGLNMRTSDRD